ncbi:hypothetical protein CVV38_03765 [Candidatus Peregrinibacteria bacterium HGW-Peregrinibacteria-1]|jgi:UDP-GlcNAc:undecaprenyl-phosphate GlcNAc-1-phosphate transferase|nr:MAG: hypothetical protein CVV38_03765 [Candidatus Peregrinibacteria bacterium HGW-Peregrinibacteria-1]
MLVSIVLLKLLNNMVIGEVFINYWLIAGVVFLISCLLIFIALKLFPVLGLMDRPHRYGLNRKPIPYYGGIAIFLAFVFSALIFVPWSLQLGMFLLAAFILVVLGLIDDYRGLPPWIRLAVQLVAALILVFSGIGILSFNVPFWGVVELNSWLWLGVPVFGALFTVLWVMTLVNTMNFVDGVSGLSSGVAFLAGLTLFFLSINPALHTDLISQSYVAVLSLILAMVSLAFLIFDFPKSRILMGDTGSTFLGFVVATLAIYSGGKVATAFLVLGIPILDMVWVVFRRIRSGGKFWKGDLNHLHHRLLRIGFSERMVVVVYLFVTFILGAMAVMFIDSKQKIFMLLALLILMLLLAFMLVHYGSKRDDKFVKPRSDD